MANSKRQWLYLAQTYEERLQLYWGDRGEAERSAKLQEELANEKAKRRKLETKLQRYETVHQRWFDFLMKELTLPPPPVPAGEPSEKMPIVVPDDPADAPGPRPAEALPHLTISERERETGRGGRRGPDAG